MVTPYTQARCHLSTRSLCTYVYSYLRMWVCVGVYIYKYIYIQWHLTHKLDVTSPAGIRLNLELNRGAHPAKNRVENIISWFHRDAIHFVNNISDDNLACVLEKFVSGIPSTIYRCATHSTRCNTLPHTSAKAIHYNTPLSHQLPYTIHCNTLLSNAAPPGLISKTDQIDTATHCNTLQHTATHCNTWQHAATNCNQPLSHAAPPGLIKRTWIKLSSFNSTC